jgi:hypothetical protein
MYMFLQLLNQGVCYAFRFKVSKSALDAKNSALGKFTKSNIYGTVVMYIRFMSYLERGEQLEEVLYTELKASGLHLPSVKCDLWFFYNRYYTPSNLQKIEEFNYADTTLQLLQPVWRNSSLTCQQEEINEISHECVKKKLKSCLHLVT